VSQADDRDMDWFWGSSLKLKNHGNEYQIKIVHKDGREELSEWMNGTEQIAPAMVRSYRPQVKAYWLLVRNILCPDCSEKEQIIAEDTLAHIPFQRYMPHDSNYLLITESRDMYSLGFPASRRLGRNFADAQNWH
jgi:hypothetical protein